MEYYSVTEISFKPCQIWMNLKRSLEIETSSLKVLQLVCFHMYCLSCGEMIDQIKQSVIFRTLTIQSGRNEAHVAWFL